MFRTTVAGALCSGLLLSGLISRAIAGDAPRLTEPDGVLSGEEMKAAARSSSVADSMLSLLSASDELEIEGVAMRPAMTLTERLSLSAQQLAADLSHAASRNLSSLSGSGGSLDKGMQSQTVFGTDDRTQVTNTAQTPFRAVCQIQITWPNGKTGTATAEFVSPRVLLTNAHCTYLKENGGWAKSVKVVPGKNGSSEPYGSAMVKSMSVPTAWINGNYSLSNVNPDYDISWLILADKTLYNRVGYYFGYQVLSDSALASYKLNMAGYPGNPKNSKMNGTTMWFQYGGGNQTVSANSYRHTLDTNPGSSGSPMWLYYTSGTYSGQSMVVGVNDAENSSTNYATRMTTSYFNSTKSFVSQNP